MQHDSRDQPDASFAVDRVVRGTTQIVTVRGDVDIAVAHAVSAVIDRAIGLLPDRVVIDLSATTFMDSAGVHCLLCAQRHARARNVDLVVIPGSTAVQRVLALCRVDQDPPHSSGSQSEGSTRDRFQRNVRGARRAATYTTGGADRNQTVSRAARG